MRQGKEKEMQALEGLKVIEVGNIIAGPWCGSLMADFGANVIKVEPPVTGDIIRGMGKFKDLWYAVEGRNKRNITLNLKEPEGKEILWKLIEDADVLINNFRPGAFDRLGFTWEALHKRNPRLIFAVASGFGTTGPYASRPGFDRMGLALGGFLEVTGYPDTPPVKPGISTADFYTALFACSAVMFAVYSRDINGTGEGQMIDCALTESVLRLQESILPEYCIDGSIRTRIGNGTTVTVPSGHFLTKDGKYLAVSISGDKLYREIMTRIGRKDLAEAEIYQDGAQRTAHREELNGIVADWAKQHDIDECMKILGEDMPVCRIYNVADIMKDPQFAYRNDIVDVETAQYGTVKMQNVVPKMSGTPGEIKWAGQPLGKFNDEIYAELGYSKAEIEDLTKRGII